MQRHCVLGLNPKGFHHISYEEWGDPENKQVVICAHGLTRNAGDFFWLAQALSKDYRIVCPDVVGRGKSQWLRDPARYQYPQYMADMNALIARVNAESIFWVGTSMGGLIGMMLASFPQNPIKKLIINDIGPFIPKAGLERLMKYAPKAHAFQSFEEATSFLKKTLLGYKDVTSQQWKQITEQSFVWDAVDKTWNSTYDPAVVSTISAKEMKDQEFWSFWDKIYCPTLVLHGMDSDLLRQETVDQMALKPCVQIRSFAGQGHALSLATETQIQTVQNFLKKS